MNFESKQYPTKPGVYLMKDRTERVIYVGKAKNIRARLLQHRKSYFFSKVEGIDVVVVTSEKEALILEEHLIKQHHPKFNVLLKDDKSYIAIKVNHRHVWPKVKLVRYRGRPKSDGLYFGPYTSAHKARETLDLIHRTFPLRQCSDEEFKRRKRPCILHEMGQCTAPCVARCTKEEYDKEVKQVVQFLRGDTKPVLRDLKKQMMQASEEEAYEKAALYRDRIDAVIKTLEKQVVAKPLGGDLDAFGLFRKDDHINIAKTLVRSGRLTGVSHFLFKKVVGEDDELLRTFLMQHYSAESVPREVLLPCEADAALGEVLGTHILVPKRGEKVQLLKIAQANAEAGFQREVEKTESLESLLVTLQQTCKLKNYPETIECIDTSNLSLSQPVAAVIATQGGKFDKKRYRTFKVDKGDDISAMREVIERRLKRGELPDLLIVDGGKGQLNVALKLLKKLDIISVNVIAVAKEKGRHDRGISQEQIFLPGMKDPILLHKRHPLLFFLQRVRDEAHRFVITFQQKQRSKQVGSALDCIKGIGPKKRKELLKHFGSIEAISKATTKELTEVRLITEKDAKIIVHHFNNE